MVYGNFILLGLWALVLLMLAVAVAGKWRAIGSALTERLNSGRSAPLFLLVLGCALHGLFWGGLSQVAIVHDEASYLLQAETFARARWSVPSPPQSEFFEQFHVLVDPVLASKYPPGHGMLLALGALFGCAGLIPILLNGLTGMMLFLLVRRVSHGWPALFAWFLLLFAPSSLAFRPSYFSEVATGFLMLLAWWELMNWRDSGRQRHLLLLAAIIGWCAITRPLTALAFTLPVGVWVLITCARKRMWRPLLGALAIGSCVVALLPIQSWRVMGDATVTPYAHYSEVYFPFDAPGFDKSNTESLRELPVDMRQFRELYLPIHRAHTPGALPGILLERIREVLHTAWGSWWLLLAPLAVVALIRGSQELYFAVASAGLMIAAYLLFAHPAAWVLYYMEAQQVIIALAAIGLWRALPSLLWFVRRGEEVPETEIPIRSGVATGILLIGMLPLSLDHAQIAHRRLLSRGAAQTTFRDQLASLPQKSVVFVRYMPGHDIHTSLITNAANLEEAHAWTVYDRGGLNPKLMREAPGRVPYIYDEETGTLHSMNPETGEIER